ncbi:MAG TPA: zinc-ribbon domain-containing protein [Pyrinomonadaceae bacterium]|nr:zinc-ribbon domain-containing protein [Pyrinomonadaceae bacterium]
MIIRCDNCSVSLQLDESKIPSGNFTVRCPRCQNLLRATKDMKGAGSSTAQQLAANQPAPATSQGAQQFAERQNDFEINNALKSLLSALHVGKTTLDDDEKGEKPRRVLLCLGERKDAVAKIMAAAGYRVYIAQTPAQANERLREGKTEVVLFSPDFAAEFGGAAILQQKANAMYSSERRRLFLVSLEDNGTTMNAHDAFLRNLNLIVNTADIPQLPLILNRALLDYNDLYHYLNIGLGVEPI